MENIDWKKVTALRDQFLKDRITIDYWSDDESLALYDRFFAARIGWKWESVWSQLRSKHFLEQASDLHIIDWGCGTGMATRVTLKHLGLEQITRVTLIDRSQRALAYATRAISEQLSSHPSPHRPVISSATELMPFPTETTTVLLVSHVLNELRPKQEDALVALAQKADACIWLEPGAKHQSLRLSACRNIIAQTHTIAAPCTHQAVCPMTAEGDDWCHHFAAIPNAIFRDRHWAQFAKTIGIDLHRLPYSFVASTKPSYAPPPPITQQLRVVGQTRFHKGYAKAQFCGKDGLSSKQINARKQRDVHRSLEAGALYFDADV